MVTDHKDEVWETKVTVKCSYCGEVIGGIGGGVKCGCGKTSLSGLLPLVESHEALRIRLKDERKTRKYPFKEMNKTVPANPLRLTVNNSVSVDTRLKILKSQEPNSDNLFFRNSIIGYEWGNLQRAIVYAERFTNKETIFKVENGKKVMFRDGFKDRNIILSEGKLAMADMLTQLYLLTLSLEWDWDELRKLGAQHLEERQKDFKRDGWKEVK